MVCPFFIQFKLLKVRKKYLNTMVCKKRHQVFTACFQFGPAGGPAIHFHGEAPRAPRGMAKQCPSGYEEDPQATRGMAQQCPSGYGENPHAASGMAQQWPPPPRETLKF